MNYLLDTNVVIEMLHGNRDVIEHIYSVGMQNCCICEMTIAELYYGAVKGNNKRNFEDIDTVRELFPIKRVEPCFGEYAKTRLILKEKGNPIDLMDVLIASVALHHGMVLVTHNRKHFERIPNLEIEDWQ